VIYYGLMTLAQLKEQIKKAPAGPGIYIFKDSQNRPLYIGKALNLRNRVGNYIKEAFALKPAIVSFGETSRLGKMISEATKIDFIETDSDIEALLLESQYIKKYNPPFNIMLRDDKQYGFVGFTDEQFSKIFITHQPGNRNSRGLRPSNLSKDKLPLEFSLPGKPTFIGPFTDIGALKITLRLLRKIFPYCTCRQTHHNYCLNYHINKCLGYCCLKELSLRLNAESLKQYKKNIKAIKYILSGQKSSLIKQFEKEMKALSDKQEYEKARKLQYKIEKLKRVFQNARIINNAPDVMVHHNKNRVLELMQKELKLPNIPHRIEAYDIANIQGQYAVGAMVVFENGIANPNEYRKFKIRNVPTSQVDTLANGGDTGMLKEILTRRFNHPEWTSPDLIIVDGGKAHYNAVKKAIYRSSTSIYPQIIALTKNEKHIGHKIITNKKEIPLSKLPVEVKNLLLRIDSEAHRFAISYYRKLHRNKLNSAT